MLIEKKLDSFKDSLSQDLQEFFNKCSKEDLDLYLIRFDLFSEQEIEELINLAAQKLMEKMDSFGSKIEKELISVDELQKKLQSIQIVISKDTFRALVAQFYEKDKVNFSELCKKLTKLQEELRMKQVSPIQVKAVESKLEVLEDKVTQKK